MLLFKKSAYNEEDTTFLGGNNLYLQKMIITNFKKFEKANFEFNKEMNIIIGHNESGKSTLLQAIDIALNQRGNGDRRNSNEYGTLLNIEATQNFLRGIRKGQTDSSYLPKIEVELFFSEDSSPNIHDNIFNGPNNSTGKIANGLTFTYSFDDRFITEYNYLVKHTTLDFIPFEFYSPHWDLFNGTSYNFRKNPFKSILIDNDKVKGDSYRAFTRQFLSTLDSSQQHTLSLKLKTHINQFNSEISQLDLGTDQLGVDPTRLIIQDSLDVFASRDRNLLLRDMGNGTENIIKTELALSSKNSRLILLEEPENHLSFDLAREQIRKIQGAKQEERQVIVSTHSPLLASKLSIDNLKWLNQDGKLVSFKSISKDITEFFLKADNIDILQVILAEKVILVEGATEYIIMQDIIKNHFGKSADQLKIHIVSMGGNYYKRFREIVNITKNKVLAITDNDGNENRIKEAAQKTNEYFYIAMPNDIKHFTFEASLYYANKSFFTSALWNHKSTIASWKEHFKLDKELVWLLNHKTDAAFEYSEYLKDKKLSIPQYITGGLEWLLK